MKKITIGFILLYAVCGIGYRAVMAGSTKPTSLPEATAINAVTTDDVTVNSLTSTAAITAGTFFEGDGSHLTGIAAGGGTLTETLKLGNTATESMSLTGVTATANTLSVGATSTYDSVNITQGLGTGDGIQITNTGGGQGLYIDSNGTTDSGHGIVIEYAGTEAAYYPLYVEQAGTQEAVYVTNTNGGAGPFTLYKGYSNNEKVTHFNASSAGTNESSVIVANQAGSGHTMEVGNSGTGDVYNGIHQGTGGRLMYLYTYGQYGTGTTASLTVDRNGGLTGVATDTAAMLALDNKSGLGAGDALVLKDNATAILTVDHTGDTSATGTLTLYSAGHDEEFGVDGTGNVAADGNLTMGGYASASQMISHSDSAYAAFFTTINADADADRAVNAFATGTAGYAGYFTAYGGDDLYGVLIENRSTGYPFTIGNYASANLSPMISITNTAAVPGNDIDSNHWSVSHEGVVTATGYISGVATGDSFTQTVCCTYDGSFACTATGTVTFTTGLATANTCGW